MTGAVAVAAVAAIPIVYLVIRAAEAQGGLGALVDPTMGRLVWNSVVLALTVGVIATVIAFALAVAIEAADFPSRRLATLLVVSPLAVPSYVAATAYKAGVSPVGPFGEMLAALGIGPVFPEGFAWAVFVLVTSTVPLAFLPLRAALAHADGDLYDAARSLGRRRTSALVTALRPTTTRAARDGFLLVALYTLAELGTVEILRYDALPRVIYQQFLSAFDRASAARSGLVLLVLVLLLVIFAGGATQTGHTGERGRLLQFRLGRGRWLAVGGLLAYVLVATVVPVVSLVAWLVKAPNAGAMLGRALEGSLQAAAIVVVPSVIAAAIIAIVAERGGKLGHGVARFVGTGFAMPGLVVALGLSVATLRLAPDFYQGWVPYTLAMMVLFVPLGVAAIRSSLATVSPAIEEAARTLGATRRAVFWRVTLPIVSPSVFAAAALIVIATMKELGASLLLIPTGKTTLAVQLWDSTEEARYGLAAAPALVLVVLAAIAALAVEHRRAVRRTS